MRSHAKASPAGPTSGRGGSVSDVQASAARRLAQMGALALVLTLALIPSGAAAAVPSISGTSASHIGANAATLNAQVNANGELTTYHFEYGTQGSCDSNPCISKPIPDGSAGGGSSNVAVSAALTGLQAGATYHFRLVATNLSSPVGGTAGPDATFATYTAPHTFGACPNDIFRTGSPSARLPDCRAYEQASPVDKNGADINGAPNQIQASTSGDAVTFFSPAGLPGTVGAQDFETYLARRGADNWSTQGVFPPANDGAVGRNAGWTTDLSQFFSLVGAGFEGHRILRERSSADGSFTAMTTVSQGTDIIVSGASADGSKVFFESMVPLVPDPGGAPGIENLYVWDRATGTVSLAGVLPDSACGSPPCIPPGGSFAGPYSWFEGTYPYTLDRGALRSAIYVQDEHAISTSGEKAFFTAGDTGQIYLRKSAAGPGAATVQVNASQRTAPDPNGIKPAIFLRATPSGSLAFFMTCEKLTNDSTAFSTADSRCDTASQGQDLYAYDTNSGELNDLTVDGTDPHGADVKGVLGASDDGSYIYFVANGDLDGAGPATTGDCQGYGTHDSLNFTGTCSLYVWHNNASTFVARLDASHKDPSNWEPHGTNIAVTMNSARVSADGQTLLFRSTRQLTAYDSEGTPELYRYHFGDSSPLCVSCNPTGAPPIGKATLQSIQPFLIVVLPPDTPPILTRNLSSDGNRVFFESPDKLVANDTNGDSGCPIGGQAFVPLCQDVYEWEANGTGTCHSSAENGGCLYLLSTGSDIDPAFFADASASGDNAFIFSRDSLVPQDQDQLTDVYDASIGGGLASQHQVRPPGCAGDACRGSFSAQPNQQGAGTAVFSGSSNPAIKRQKHRKRHHRKRHHKKASKRASANRGGVR